MARIESEGLDGVAHALAEVSERVVGIEHAATGALAEIGRADAGSAVVSRLTAADHRLGATSVDLANRASLARRAEATRWASPGAGIGEWSTTSSGDRGQPGLSDDDDYEFGVLPADRFGLWGPDGKGAPNLSDINQGSLGDCWVLAGLGAVAHNDPDFLAEHIEDHGDGTYTVTFYERKGFGAFTPVEITVDGAIPLTTDGTAAYAKPSDDGETWTVIYEKAYAEFRGGSYEDIEGGSAQTSLEAITGMEYDRLDPRDVGDADLAVALQDGPVAVGMRNPARIGNWIVPWDRDLVDMFESLKVQDSHQYVVESVDRIDGEWVVTLYNPWGDTAYRPVLALDELRSVSDEVDVRHIFYDPPPPGGWEITEGIVV